MKGRPVVALGVVGLEVQRAYDYFEVRAPGKGEDFLECYFALTERMAENPEIFPPKI
jgi:hypothetical protein